MPRINWMRYNEQPVQNWKNNRYQQAGEHMNELQGLRTFGLTDSLPGAVECTRQYALTLYGVKKKAKRQPGSSLDELRHASLKTTSH